MEQYSVAEIVEQAIQTERLGHDFYVHMARKFEKDEKLKGLFDTLAAKELQHEKRFVELKNSLSSKIIDDYDEVSEYLRAIVESEFFLGSHKSLPSLDHLESPHDVLGFALGFEKETLLYYYSLRDVVDDKNVIDEIVREEKGHIKWLTDFRRNQERTQTRS